MYEPTNNIRIDLMNIRLSYNNVYKAEVPKQFPNNPSSFRATFIIPPSSQYFSQIKNVIDNVVAANYKGKGVCETPFKNGNEKSYAGWADNFILQSSSPEKQRPQVRKRNGQISMPDDDLFYPGCYVNAVVEIYYYPIYAKVCCSLKAIQFREDGERLQGTEVEESFFKNYDEESPQQPAPWMNQIPQQGLQNAGNQNLGSIPQKRTFF